MEESTHFSCVKKLKAETLPREFLGKNIKSQNLIRSEIGNEITSRTELYHRPAVGSLAFIKRTLMK